MWVYVRVCVFEGKGGFRRVSLPGSLLGLHSLNLFFYKGPCLAERGQPARIKKKGVGKSSQGCNCCYVGEKYSGVLWYLSIQFGSRPVSADVLMS